MILNDVAEARGLKPPRGYSDWSLDLKIRIGDIMYPWEVTLTSPDGVKWSSRGGTPREALNNAMYAAKIG